jgi:hypothetical protein
MVMSSPVRAAKIEFTITRQLKNLNNFGIAQDKRQIPYMY